MNPYCNFRWYPTLFNFQMSKIKIILLFIFSGQFIDSQNFAPYITIPSIIEPTGTLIADMNNDGLNDLIVKFGSDSGKIGIYYQQENGTLGMIQPISLNSYYAQSFDVGDLNEDGLNDLVVCHGNKYSIIFQNPSGGFMPRQEIDMFTSGNVIRIGDINNDQKNDIVLVTYNKINYLTQTQAGVFQLTSEDYPKNGFTEFKIVDINNDHLNDLVFSYPGMATLYTFLQKSTGGFETPVATYSSNWMNDFAVGDLNQDGLTDLVSNVNISGNSKINVYYPALNQYIFYSYIAYPVFGNSGTIEIADLNNDGKNEIIIGHPGYNSYSIFSSKYGNYKLISTSYMPYNNSADTQSLSIGDLNNDGLKDLAFSFTSGINIIYNTSPILTVNQTNIAREIIHPNPVLDFISLQNNHINVNYIIFDYSGKTVRQGKVQSNNKIDVSNLIPATYLLKLMGINGETSLKFLKK